MALLYGEIYYMQRFKNIGIITVLGMPLKKYFRQEYVLIRHQYRKVNFYIAQYPNLRNIHSALHFTPWLTYSIKHRLNFSWKHAAICYN